MEDRRANDMEACGQQVFALEEALLCSKQTISTLQQKNISLQIELCQAQINASHCHKEHQTLFVAHETQQRTAKLMEKQLHTLRENVSLFTTRIDTLCAEKNDHIFLVAALEQKLEKCHFAAVQFDEKLREMNKKKHFETNEKSVAMQREGNRIMEAEVSIERPKASHGASRGADRYIHAAESQQSKVQRYIPCNWYLCTKL
ncbi:hypothetical protein ABG067_006276 [Albugo candida]